MPARMIGRSVILVFGVTFAVALIAPNLVRAGADGAAPAAPAAATPPPARYGATEELRRDMDGHFRADVLINGQPLRMVVDSGASFIAISESHARRLGIAPPAHAYTRRAQTANGDVAYAPIRIASVRIGAIERVDIAAGVIAGDAPGVPLLGQSFLRELSETTVSGDVMRIR